MRSECKYRTRPKTFQHLGVSSRKQSPQRRLEGVASKARGKPGWLGVPKYKWKRSASRREWCLVLNAECCWTGPWLLDLGMWRLLVILMCYFLEQWRQKAWMLSECVKESTSQPDTQLSRALLYLQHLSRQFFFWKTVLFLSEALMLSVKLTKCSLFATEE